MSWVERAADRSPAVQRSRLRSSRQTLAIVAAAERLMAEKGGAFTTHEVAKEAGVALQTLYRHFDSKDHLLLAVFEDLLLRASARYEDEDLDVDPLERLHVQFTASLDVPERAGPGRRFLTSEYWRLYELFPDDMARATQPLVDSTERLLRACIDAGVLHSDDPAGDAWLLTKMVMAIFHHRAFAPDDPPAQQAKERLWSFCLNALAPRVGPTT